MATQDDEVELLEVRLDMSAADPGTSVRTPDDDDTVGGSDTPAVDPSGCTPDDDNAVGGLDMPAVDPSERTPECVLEDLENVIQDDDDDVESVKRYLTELVKLLQDDSTMGMGERPAASSALCYAAWVGDIAVMDTLILKGVDINTKSSVYARRWAKNEFTPLHVAACRGNSDTVTFLVDKGADVNIQDDDGRTPICWAAICKRFDTVRCLCEKGADVNIKDGIGRTPLYWVAQIGDFETVRFLGENGADVNMKDKDGHTPLYEAASQCHADVVRYLSDKSGADINIKDDTGGTLLHLAIQNRETVECLVDRGADVNMKDNDGNTPLHLATERGRLDTVTYLHGKGADVNVRNHLGSTPLHIVTQYWCFCKEVPKYLVDHGADVNMKDNDGNTPLHLAAQEDYLDAVEYLVGKGADVNIRNNLGSTPLHIATTEHREDVQKFLKCHGADVNVNSGKGVLEDLNKTIQDGEVESFNQRLLQVEEFFQDSDNTMRGLATGGALCYAARVGSIQMMDTLIQKGVDVNTKSDIEIELYEGEWGTAQSAPLLEAARSGKLDTVKYLVEKGADVHVKGYGGRTTLHEAARSGQVGLVKYLVEKGVDINIKDGYGNAPLHVAVSRGTTEMVTYLSDKGADVAIKGKDLRTPLHTAAENGKVDMVRYFVDKKGADVDVRDKDGFTPLHLAAHRGKFDTVKYLVEKGADVNVKGYEDRTPLYFAADHGHIDVVRYLCDKGADHNSKSDHECIPLHVAAINGSVDVVRYLSDKTADVDIKDNSGATPLYYACVNGNVEAVKFLLEKGADPTTSKSALSMAVSSRYKDIAALLLGHDKWKEILDSALMKELIVFMPDVAEMVFNGCVTTNDGKKDDKGNEVHVTSDTFKVDLNYEFLEDVQDKHTSDSSAEPFHPKKFAKCDHPLNLIRENGCSNLLKHPLVISLLEHKWTRFGRYIFFGNLFIYLIFLAFLTAFGLVVLSPLEKTCVDVLNGSFNGTTPESCEGLSIHEYRFLYVGAAVTVLTALLRLALEIFQLCRHPLEYLQDWVNWLEIPLYLCSIMFTFVFATPCLCVYSWQWQIGVVAIFLGWVGLITFLQKWPVTGVYVLMFVNILGSFMKIAFLALLLVIAFALAFYMLLFEPDEMRTAFSHPGRAIVKVMAMTTGELDYDDIYHQQEGEDEIAFPPVSFLLWIIFLVLMPVLLSNLLVGLAVGDVDRLQKTANENRIGLQIDLVLSFEELLDSLGIRRRFAIESPKICYPNMPATLLPEWCKKGAADDDLIYRPKDHKLQTRMGKWYSKLWITDEYSTSGVKISDAIKPPPESIEKQLQMQRQQLEAKLQKQDDRMESQLKEQSEQLKEQSEQLKEQSEQLKEQSEQLNEQLKGQSEQLNEQLKGQSERLKEQSEQFEAKLIQHSEKQSQQFQEAIRKLSECHKEQAKQSEEQAKKMEEQSEHLAGEVASLKEALEKLVAQIAAK